MSDSPTPPPVTLRQGDAPAAHVADADRAAALAAFESALERVLLLVPLPDVEIFVLGVQDGVGVWGAAPHPRHDGPAYLAGFGIGQRVMHTVLNDAPMHPPWESET